MRPISLRTCVRPAAPRVAHQATGVQLDGEAVCVERSSATQLSRDQEHSTGELVKLMTEQVSEAVASVKADVEEIKERTHR